MLQAIPESRKLKIISLYNDYLSIPYVDVRTEIGPDQWLRTSAKQRNKITRNMLDVFSIEKQVKELIKTDLQLEIEAKEKTAADKEKILSYVKNRMYVIETFCSRKLNSKRQNPTKTEYAALKAELLK
jgi:hypothetical protein